MEDAECILLVDTANGFNNLSRYAMLVQSWLWWANGSRFAMNCYCHYPLLCLRDLGQAAVWLRIREGVTQEDILAMMLYGIATVVLLEEVKEDVPRVVV